MPAAEVTRPSLAIGILTAVLRGRGVSVRGHYENVHWFAEIGPDAHEAVLATSPADMLVEWVFAGAALDREADAGAFAELLQRRDGRLAQASTDVVVASLEQLRGAAPAFIAAAADRVLADSPTAVGCTSMFQQHMASLALLRAIKSRAPHVVTLMGGANCETVMGRATHQRFPWVDYVVSGEADVLVGPLWDAIVTHGAAVPIEDLPEGVFGPSHRTVGYPTAAYGDGTPRAVVEDMSAVPTPDFADYFDTLRAVPEGRLVIPGVPFETSRGCWWGERHHCTFCGLNGWGMGYRHRTAERSLLEVRTLHERYGVDRLEAVDNILAMPFFQDFLPALAAPEEPERALFFETKANLRPDHVKALAAAGVRWIQPGIESLHSEILTLMRKGAKAWQNISLLVACAQHGVAPSWAVIAGFPGEDDAWYRDVAAFVPHLHHLPPGGIAGLRYDRYSPYASNPVEWGLELAPAAPYHHVYGTGFDVAPHAYYYDASGQAPLVGDLGRRALTERPGVEALRDALQTWGRAAERGARLDAEVSDGTWAVYDSRGGEITESSVTGCTATVLAACEGGASMRSLKSALVGEDHTERAVSNAVEMLVQRGWVLAIDGRLLTLVLRRPVAPQPPRIRFPGGSVLRPEFLEPG